MSSQGTNGLSAAGTRMSRNAACTSCRTSKVRCNPSKTAGQPCQRCSKLELSCVIDPGYRRVTRKSQLDQLTREVQAIKETVQPQPPPAPAVTNSWSTQNTSAIAAPRDVSGGISPSTTAVATQSAYSAAASEHHPTPRDSINVAGTSGGIVTPSLPRALNSQPFTGEDIDHYFQTYFLHFHPFVPIISERDPNKCYEATPLLFWIVILISSRRYSTSSSSAATVRLLTEHIKHELDSVVAKLPRGLEIVHAMCLVSAWGLMTPDVRFIRDVAHWLMGIAVSSCIMMGLHTGRGKHPEYSFMMFENKFLDCEAAVTWAACNIVAQSVSSYLGVPTSAACFNKAIRNLVSGTSPEVATFPPLFQTQLICQEFLNRVSKTMLSFLEEVEGVPEHVVHSFEDEWTLTQATVLAHNSDPVSSLYLLLVQQEIQAYYLLPLPSNTSAADKSPPLSVETNFLRCFWTAQTVLNKIMDLDRAIDLLRHIPHITFRAIMNSIVITFKVRHSYLYKNSASPSSTSSSASVSTTTRLDRETIDKVCADALTICHRSSAVEGDLPSRLARFAELWNNSAHLTLGTRSRAGGGGDQGTTAVVEEEEECLIATSFRQRMAAGIGFCFMTRWKEKFGPLLTGPDGPLAQGLTQAQQHCQGQQNWTQGGNMGGQQKGGTAGSLPSSVVTAGGQHQPQQQQQTGQPGGLMVSNNNMNVLPSAGVEFDPLFGGDWGFLDEFGWGFEMPI